MSQSKLPGGGEGAMLAAEMSFRCVVGVVALLAESGQVAFGVVGRILVEVGGGEEHLAAGFGMGLAVRTSAPFTEAAGAPETDAPGDFFPVGRVEVPH